MSENEIVRARIDGSIKEEAAPVLSAVGITVSDAFRLMMTRIASDCVGRFIGGLGALGT